MFHQNGNNFDFGASQALQPKDFHYLIILSQQFTGAYLSNFTFKLGLHFDHFKNYSRYF